MRTKVIHIIAFCSWLGSPAWAERAMEIRLLHVTGEPPNEKMLHRLVDDAGALVAEKLEVAVDVEGKIKIKEVTPYRYPSEYTSTGEPSAYETRELGVSGSGTIADEEAGTARLKIDLSGTFLGAPRVYDVNGAQVFMPIFTQVTAPAEELSLSPGEWCFVRRNIAGEIYFWAIRLKNQ